MSQQQFSKAPTSLYTTQNLVALALCCGIGAVWVAQRLLRFQSARTRARRFTESTKHFLDMPAATTVSSPASNLLSVPVASDGQTGSSSNNRKRRPFRGSNKSSSAANTSASVSRSTSPAASTPTALPRVPSNPASSSISTRSIGIQAGPDIEHLGVQTESNNQSFDFFDVPSMNTSVYGDIESEGEPESTSGSPFMSRSRLSASSQQPPSSLNKPLPSFTEKLRQNNHARQRSNISAISVPTTARPHLQENLLQTPSSSRNASSSASSLFSPNEHVSHSGGTSNSSELDSSPTFAEGQVATPSTGKRTPASSKRKGSLAKGKWVPGMVKPEKDDGEYWTLDPAPEGVNANGGIKKRNTITRKNSLLPPQNEASSDATTPISQQQQGQSRSSRRNSVAELTKENIEAIASTSNQRTPLSASASMSGTSDTGLPPYPGMPAYMNMQSPRTVSMPQQSFNPNPNQQRRESIPHPVQLQAQFYQHQQQLQQFLHQQMVLQHQQQFRALANTHAAYAASQQAQAQAAAQQQGQQQTPNAQLQQSQNGQQSQQKNHRPANLMVPPVRPNANFRTPSSSHLQGPYAADPSGQYATTSNGQSPNPPMQLPLPSPSSGYFPTNQVPPSPTYTNSSMNGMRGQSRSIQPPTPNAMDTKFFAKLDKLENRVKEYEVDNERKAKELEIAAWRLKCVEVERAAERAAEEKQKHEAISYFVERAEAAEARIKALEQQFGLVVSAAEDELASDRDRSGSFSTSDTGTSQNSGSPKGSLTGRHSPSLTPLDTSIGSSNFYSSPTTAPYSSTSFSSYGSPIPFDSPAPAHYRKKGKKTRNASYRNTPNGKQNGLSPTVGRSPLLQPTNVQSDDSAEDEITLFSTSNHNTPYLGSSLGRSTASNPGDSEEQQPIGLGFDLEIDAEQQADCELHNYVGNVPSFFLKAADSDQSTPTANQSPIETRMVQ